MPDAPLYPPTFRPPDVPLGTLEFLVRCAQIPLATIPIGAYREPVAAVTARHTRAIWLSDPDDIERVLLGEAANFRKTDIEKRLFAPVIGNGVLTAEGADWRWQRGVGWANPDTPPHRSRHDRGHLRRHRAHYALRR
jgi:hypothetical protein